MIPLSNLNGRFKYRREDDKLPLDNWRIMKGLGTIWGDCEDYALTLIWLLQDQSKVKFWWALLTWKYMVYHCEYNGDGHAVLRRRSDGMWIDNIGRSWNNKLSPKYDVKYPYTIFGVAIKMVAATIMRKVKGVK